MSIRVERKGDRVKVETDYPGSDVDHSVIHEDTKLTAGMRNYGIDKIETQKSEFGASSSIKEGFDREYKKKYGKDNDGYYSF